MLTVLYEREIEAGITATLFSALSTALNSSSVNVEFCKGAISQAKADVEVLQCDWIKIENQVTAQLGVSRLQRLVENSIPLIGLKTGT